MAGWEWKERKERPLEISPMKGRVPFHLTFILFYLRALSFIVPEDHSNFPRLDGEHVVFGKVIQGMDTVYAIEGGAGTYSGKPRKKVIIADSGEIPKSKWDEEK